MIILNYTLCNPNLYMDPIDSHPRVLVTFNPRINLEGELQQISDLCKSLDIEYRFRLNQDGIVVALINPKDSVDKLVGDYNTFFIKEFTGISLQPLTLMPLPSQCIPVGVMDILRKLQEDCC